MWFTVRLLPGGMWAGFVHGPTLVGQMCPRALPWDGVGLLLVCTLSLCMCVVVAVASLAVWLDRSCPAVLCLVAPALLSCVAVWGDLGGPSVVLFLSGGSQCGPSGDHHSHSLLSNISPNCAHRGGLGCATGLFPGQSVQTCFADRQWSSRFAPQCLPWAGVRALGHPLVPCHRPLVASAFRRHGCPAVAALSVVSCASGKPV